MQNNLVFIGDITPYLAQKETVRKKQFARLLAEADRYASFDLPATHPNGSTTYLGVAIVNLALAYRMTENEKYLTEAKRFMRTVLSYEKWGFAHLVNVDLSASWILFGLSLGYDWLKDYLTEEERVAVRSKVEHHAKIIYDYKIETTGTDWSTAYYQNHNWINLNSLATAGYVLGVPEYTEMAKENFAKVYNYMPEDGSNYEGVVYWRYGGMWLFVYAHLLKVQEGFDYFQESDYLKNTFYYRLYQSSPNFAQQLNFGDAHDRHSGHTPCVYYKTAAEYGDGYAQTYGNFVLENFLTLEAENSKVKPGILPEATFEFLWYDPTVAEKPLSDLPTTRYFGDLGLLCMRTSWAQDAKVFSMKCSAPGGHKQWKIGWDLYKNENIDCINLMHHHPDNLSYIYAVGDDYLTCEDGYNRNLLPDNHNVLLVDGEYTDVMDLNDVYTETAKQRLAQNPNMNVTTDYTGEVTTFAQKDGMVYYQGDTYKIYPEALQMREVSRGFFTDNLDVMIMVDRLVSDTAHTYSIIHNTCVHGKPVSENTFAYEVNGETLHYSVCGDAALVSTQYDQTIVGVMTTQEPDKVCRADIKTARFDTKEPCKTMLAFECFAPADATVTYEPYKVTVQGKKTYTMIAKEGFALYHINSKKDVYITVQDADKTAVYEW